MSSDSQPNRTASIYGAIQRARENLAITIERSDHDLLVGRETAQVSVAICADDGVSPAEVAGVVQAAARDWIAEQAIADENEGDNAGDEGNADDQDATKYGDLLPDGGRAMITTDVAVPRDLWRQLRAEGIRQGRDVDEQLAAVLRRRYDDAGTGGEDGA